jgi:iron(III) transport system substrate-binding protein
MEKVMKKMPVLNINKRIRQCTMGGIVLFMCIFGFELSVGASELNIYSHRQPFLINPFIDVYQAKTGVKVNIVYASKGLAQRLQSEGERSPADVILTVDMARLNVYVDKGLLASVQSKTLLKNVPAHLRDPNNRWFSFSKRARVIVLSLKSKGTGEIKKYEDLVNPKWKGRICVRPGSHVYNRALVSSMINAGGTEFAENWASGLIKNLARRPQGNDRAQVKAIYEGVCDIAIINNYYFGKLKYSNKEEQRKWAAAVKLIFPNQKGRGAHINISGGGVAKHSKNKMEAVRFLEFLTSKEAQNLYGSVNFEYPVNPSVEVPEELQSWGSFKEDQMPISIIAKLAPDAQRIIDRVGW